MKALFLAAVLFAFTIRAFAVVELSAFEAIPGNQIVLLAWITASESQNDHFELLREGVTIADLNGAGSSASSHGYCFSNESVVNDSSYHYTLTAVASDGTHQELPTITARPHGPAAAEPLRPIPSSVSLSAYPNPFNPSATISLDIPNPGNVCITVYNVEGREVATLADGPLPSGHSEFTLNASRLPSGLYLVRASAKSFTRTEKLLLVK